MNKKPLKTIFVIMPFVQVSGGARDEARLSAFFLNHIKGPIESAEHLQHKYKVTRSGEAFSITREIISELCCADIVIADLSGIEPNPNVMYELGVRLAVSNAPVILIRESMTGTKSPFDVFGYYTKPYDPLDYSQLQTHLLGKLARLETGEEGFDNEVLRIIREELTFIRPDPTSISPDKQRTLVLRGIRMLADITRTAYGPLGRGMQVPTAASFAITGHDIALALRSNNPFEQEGIRFLGHAARSIFEQYSDGSKQVILMTAAMIEVAADGTNINSGAAVAEKLISMAQLIIERLHKSAASIGLEQWPGLAATAAKVEKMPSELLGVINLVNQGGSVTIEDSSAPGIHTVRQEHYKLERGAVREDFLTEENHTLTSLSDALVLISPCSVTSLRQVLPILEKVVQTNRPLLFVAERFEDEVLTALRLNSIRGALKCVPVLAPGFGDRRIGMLQDLAALTGATVLDPQTGLSIENAALSYLGSAEKIIITATSTEIQLGGGEANLIAERIGNIRSKLRSSHSDYEREQLERRMALLSGLSSTVFVGAPTTESRQLLKRQVLEAVGACSLAMQEGTVVAAASHLARLAAVSSDVASVDPTGPADRILKAGLEAPLRALIQNAGGDEKAVFQAVRNGEAFDGRQCRLIAEGETPLRDAVALVSAVVSIAASTTSTFLRTGSWSPSSRQDDEAQRESGLTVGGSLESFQADDS